MNAEASFVNELDDFKALDIVNLSTSFSKKQRVTEQMTANIKKMTPRETFFALIKGYTALASLLMPKAFLTGGWAVSTGMLVTSSVITTICACMLVDTGLKLGVYSYPLVVEKVLGRKGKVALDIMVAMTQWSFVISHITFLFTTYKDTVD